jgi:transposase-like protein
MDSCPKCKSKNFRKDGIVKSKQRYLCKDCKHRFTVEQIGKPNTVKRDALILYLEGLGFRSIGRFLNVSHVAVFNWIKSFGEKLDEFRNTEEIEVVELDEMHTYVGSKKTTVGYGLLLIEMGIDSSIVKLAHEEQKQEKNFGRKLEILQKE